MGSSLKDNTRKEVFLWGYSGFRVERTGVLNFPLPKHGARFQVERDLSPLFPYINSSIRGARYLDNPERVQFLFRGITCTLYPHEIVAAAFDDREQAARFGEELRTFLNGLYDKRDTLEPDFRKERVVSALDIYKILPRTNCGECGKPSCLAFAGALSKGFISQDRCPHLKPPMGTKVVYPVLDKDGRLTGTVELDLPARKGDEPEEKSSLESLLTEREIEVLKLLALGKTNKEISQQLFISPHTVKTHVAHIFEKLEVNDRAQAAVLASRHYLV